MRKLFGRIREGATRARQRLKAFILRKLEDLTYSISRLTTGAVWTLGSLAGIHNSSGQLNIDRLMSAGMAFIIGLPLGLIVFGSNFNLFVWLAICIVTLFLMNLHNAWETVRSLRHGGLDYHMARSVIDSVETVTPDDEAYKRLQFQYNKVKQRVMKNSLRDNVFDDMRLMQEST